LAAHDKVVPRHRRALEWFVEHEGELVAWPEPLQDATLLATRAKGIYKPQWSPYALSIRQALDGPYPDLAIESLPDGSWQYKYFQEGLTVAAHAETFTNRGLMACMRDAIPVGVLIQQSKKPSTRYLVQGLAFVNGWDEDGYFHLSGFPARSVLLERVALASTTPTSPTQFADRIADAFDPRRVEDERRKVIRSVIERRGQSGFRLMLLDAYGSRCAATGFDAVDALEAAHIIPYRGPVTNHVSNGLLLRADLHTLFDMDLLAVHEGDRCLILSRELRRTKYSILHGKPVAPPAAGYPPPSEEALRSHRIRAGL
jgi:hypothetical protein